MTNKSKEIDQQLLQQLRNNAEAHLDRTERIKSPPMPNDALLHELRVHQIELEIQNEELRRMQLALEASRDRYVDLYEFAPVGYLTLTLDGIINAANFTAATLLGIERVKLINHRFAHYISHEDKDRWHHHFLHCKQQSEKQTIELALRRADGTYLYAHIDCLMINADDELPVLRITLTDITARKQAEDALCERKARLTSILNGAELATWDWNIKTGYVEFNERWAAMRGYQLAEVEPDINFWRKNIFPDDIPNLQKALTEYFEGHTPFFNAEYRFNSKSGAWIWIMNRSIAIQRDIEGNPQRMAGIEMDISQYKQMQERLRIAAVAFETHTGIMITDANKSIICVNRAFSDTTGYADKEMIGQTPFFLRSGLYDEDFYQTIWDSLARHGYWEGELWDKRKNGELFPVWLTIVSVIDANGFITHYVGSFTDLTVQKQAEKILLDAHQQLENQVASTQEELEKIREDSAKINAALNVLLKYRETDKYSAQDSLSREMESTVLPFLKKLKRISHDKNQICLIDMLENNLQHLVSCYGRDNCLSSVCQKLTPTEIQIASMVRKGLSTKLIATTLHISAGTVAIHRKNIRKKLGLDSRDNNLYSYLVSLSE